MYKTDKKSDISVFWIVLLLIWSFSFITQHNFSSLLGVSEIGSQHLADDVAAGSTVRRVTIPLMAFIGIILMMRYGKRRFRINGLLGWALLIFFLWIFSSILWTADPQLTTRRLIAFSFFLLSALGVSLISFKRLPLFIIVFCGLNLIAGISAEMVTGTFLPGTSDYRFSGTLHPNLQGVNLSFLILGSLWLLNSTVGIKRVLLVFFMITAILFLLLTQSRTSMGALIFAVGLTISLQMIRTKGAGSLIALFSAIFLVLCPILIFLIINPEASITNITYDIISRERDQGNPLALTGRVDLWELLVSDYVTQKPFLGFGYDAFWSPERILEISSKRMWPINQAHNSYIELLLNLGVIGLCLYTIVLIIGIKITITRFFKGKIEYGVAACILLFIFLHNCLESINVLPLFPGFISFMILLNSGYIQNLNSEQS